MLIIATSPDAVKINGKPDPDVVKALIDAKAAGNPVGLISNHAEPAWFEDTFGVSGVQFLCTRGRQDGHIISENAERHSLPPYDALVLAAKPEDVRMGKNGGAVLIAAGWGSQDQKVQSLGIRVDTADELREVISLSAQWPGGWWYTADMPGYSVRALADLSGYGKSDPQIVFSKKLTATVKKGGGRLNALLAIVARSLLSDGFGAEKDLVWGVYPSSSSDNDDDEVLSDFVHRLRTTVSRVRYAKRGEPLFYRHSPSPKRSIGGGGDRKDPTDQITTIHLNPFYADKGRLVGKHVVIVDDCTTYGVSFGVASAFLKAAGAAKVTCIALGKFGNKVGYYEIAINSNPSAPVAATGFEASRVGFSGETNGTSQHQLLSLIP